MAVTLSERHGVNPTMGVCMYCRRPDNTIGLLGRLPGDKEADRYSILSDVPCDTCQELMKQGILLVEVLEMKEIEVPVGQEKVTRYRRFEKRKVPVCSGTIAVVTEDWVRRVINPEELRDHILRKRMSFVSSEDWDAIGLPREDMDNRNEVEQKGVQD